jgi:hypothetical protein
VEDYVASTRENGLSEYVGNELAIHTELAELRRIELKEYKDVFASLKGSELEQEDLDPIEVPEPMAYKSGFGYGSHPNFTFDGASVPAGQPYLWRLYTDWLLEVRCEDATMEDFWKGFIDGVVTLSVESKKEKQ